MQDKEQDNLDNDFENHTSDLHEQKNHLKKIQAYVIFAVGGLLLVLILVYFLKSFLSSNTTTEEAPKEENNDIAQSVKTKEFAPPPSSSTQKTFDELMAQEQPTQTTALMLEAEPPKPRIVKGIGVTVVASSNNGFNGGSTGDRGEFGDKPNTVFEFGQNGSGALQNSNNFQSGGEFTGEVFTPTIAKVSEFDQNLLLPKGTYIGCALKTRLVSSIKGGIACIVSNNVYSANGNTLLIEKGSTITGTFNAGQLDDGMDRLFVIWQEIRTPNNIIIPVYSGATDELGASGMQGWVDHHYMKRFGSAILLSMIDDSMAILADQLSKNGNNNNYYNYSENTRENVNEIANTALEKMIDIKPTLYKNHGDLVGVYVNRDIDFSKVYKLTRKKNVNYTR
ncbi:type IV secretion system protein VirB10 [Campylobacter coli]|uniref:type IV secretion system protein VirB10 n=1 Tax=Campylobacter coli TaxID=195 RepID=UPI0007173E93|nr:type IV secretion system protein VirB10 [Campylobacter coli]EAL4281588.1 type IV secretion system protein VirB10 [Campylobacter coli]EAL4294040.1 type IV secretion system protein VirB10 [Campylobacter coli]KRS77953.1 type IV secretion system protein VirB10 [Campylobacter coli]